MALFAWVMMAIALWHFAIWIPDRFWGGIVGAFLGAIAGGIISGLLLNGLTIPGQHDTHVLQALEAVPGAIIGMFAVYGAGVRKDIPALEL